jgi:hypothetical protein
MDANHDEDLLAELAAAHRGLDEADLARASRAGRAAFALGALDEELTFASLVYDSVLDQELSLARADTATRTLAFESATCSIELEVTADRIVGQVVPSDAGSVTAEFGDGRSVTAVTDALGCFALPAPRTGQFRLRVRAGTWALVTEWAALRS